MVDFKDDKYQTVGDYYVDDKLIKALFKSNRTTTTKSVNAEETVRRAIRASATNEVHNFVS
ncbi:hypothetical protein H8356DRAFT_1425284 [Neocallimastix lanati (nom. inval.)]|nr:hypothetical protein H8356DRAFT_1425284 [Neocallimastix sp. JGI-2020a]